MIPIQTLNQFQRFDGWLSDAKATHGFKIATTYDKVHAPEYDSSRWEWHNVHRSEISRMKQTYNSPDLTDPIRCSYIALCTETESSNNQVSESYDEAEYVVDVEPCQTFHDNQQQLHTMWIAQQELVLEKLDNGQVEDALGMTGHGYDTTMEQVYYDGRYLYRLPWTMDAELTDDILIKSGARAVNKSNTMWSMKVAAVSLSANQDWSSTTVPMTNSTLVIYKSPDDDTIWGHTPPSGFMSLNTMASLSTGADGMDTLNEELTLTLDFALDAARVVGRWCGAASVDALELPRAMLALQTVNLSNLHPSERALTPIALTFEKAIVWLMGRARICEQPIQCLDFRSLFNDLFMRRTCMSVRRIEVRKNATMGQPIPQLDIDDASSAAALHVASKEKARQKRHAGFVTRNRKAAQAAQEAHATKMGGRRTRRGGTRTSKRLTTPVDSNTKHVA